LGGNVLRAGRLLDRRGPRRRRRHRHRPASRSLRTVRGTLVHQLADRTGAVPGLLFDSPVIRMWARTWARWLLVALALLALPWPGARTGTVPAALAGIIAAPGARPLHGQSLRAQP